MRIWDLQKFSDNTAVVSEEGISISYAELDKMSHELAGAIGKRCLVFCMCENSIGSLLGYVSCLNHDIVPALLNAQIDREVLKKLTSNYSPEYVWIPEKSDISTIGGKVTYKAFGYCLLKISGAKLSEKGAIYEELALLLTTSGSTGSPKFVRQSYKNIRANTDSIINYLGITENERAITTLPMNYTYGLSIINTHLDSGATLLMTDKGLMQKEFWEFFKAQKATSFGGVPYTYEMLDRLKFTRMNLPHLKTMTQAGGKITPQLHSKFAEYAQKQGKKFVVMYGQCEATARMGYLPPDKAVEKCGSMGIAIPGGRYRLIDASGSEITEPHTTGELVYEGDNVTLGYAEKREDLSLVDERHGILETGDMAQFDEDGYYYIVGRKKRFLKIYGNRVSLDEVERLIKGHFSELEVACGGIDDHMYIFLTDETKLSEISEFVSQKTRLNHAAFNMRYIPEIPKNDSGKTRYIEFEKYYKE